jgi:hypothetical protein
MSTYLIRYLRRVFLVCALLGGELPGQAVATQEIPLRELGGDRCYIFSHPGKAPLSVARLNLVAVEKPPRDYLVMYAPEPILDAR